MKATGIVRRIDDLGRVVIPQDIRRTMKIHEGDPLEFFTEGDAICLKKYETPQEDFAEKCAKWVQEHRNDILSVNFVDKTTYVMFMYRGKVRNISVKFNPKDKFDMNVAICYAADKAGFPMFKGFYD